jgi:hypothetical protein
MEKGDRVLLFMLQQFPDRRMEKRGRESERAFLHILSPPPILQWCMSVRHVATLGNALSEREAR